MHVRWSKRGKENFVGTHSRNAYRSEEEEKRLALHARFACFPLKVECSRDQLSVYRAYTQIAFFFTSKRRQFAHKSSTLLAINHQINLPIYSKSLSFAILQIETSDVEFRSSRSPHRKKLIAKMETICRKQRYTYGGGHLSSHPWQRCHAFDAHVQLGDENTIIDCESLEIPRVS